MNTKNIRLKILEASSKKLGYEVRGCHLFPNKDIAALHKSGQEVALEPQVHSFKARRIAQLLLTTF